MNGFASKGFHAVLFCYTYSPISQKCRVDLVRPLLHFLGGSLLVRISYKPKELQKEINNKIITV